MAQKQSRIKSEVSKAKELLEIIEMMKAHKVGHVKHGEIEVNLTPLAFQPEVNMSELRSKTDEEIAADVRRKLEEDLYYSAGSNPKT